MSTQHHTAMHRITPAGFEPSEDCAREGLAIMRAASAQNDAPDLYDSKPLPKRSRTFRDDDDKPGLLLMQGLRAVGLTFACYAIACIFCPEVRPW